MRQAMIHLAFAGLGAEEALTETFEANAPSLGTSHSIGYVQNVEQRSVRRNGVGRIITPGPGALDAHPT
jgi:hypothetical protein